MDTTKILADLKKRPGFAENVGMVLVHNGVSGAGRVRITLQSSPCASIMMPKG